MGFRRFWSLWWTLCVIVGAIAPALGADVRVRVECSRPEAVRGANVSVLRERPGLDGLRPAIDPVAFDDGGVASLALPPGAYVFEVLHLGEANTVVALRSGQVRVRAGAAETVVTLAAEPPRPVTLTLDLKPVEVREFAIRSAGATGEVRWQWIATIDKTPLTAVLSPRTEYHCSLIGRNEAEHVAVWQEVRPAAELRVALAAAGLNTCTFAAREVAEGVDAYGTLLFPDARIELKIEPAAKLYTNRAFVLYQYWLDFPDAKKLYFKPRACMLSRRYAFEYGGALGAKAWAAAIMRDDGTNHAMWGVSVTDPDGQEVDTESSSFGFSASAKLDAGDWTTANPLAEVPADADLTRRVQVRAEWALKEPVAVTLRPEPMVTVSSEHYALQAPRFWRFQAANYLTKAERIRRIEQVITGRPGPNKTSIYWRTNAHNALGSVGGEPARAWMPFYALATYDWFGAPSMLAHEVLHNFGYHHGEEMTRLEGETEALFQEFRWYMADHPEWRP